MRQALSGFLNHKLHSEATFIFPLRRAGELLGGILGTLSLDGVLGSARQTAKFVLLYMILGALVAGETEAAVARVAEGLRAIDPLRES